MAKKNDIFIQEFLIDLKAATLIGDIETIANALEFALDIPEIASNQHLAESNLQNITLPIGRILARPTVDEIFLSALIKDPLCGIRAMSGVAQVIRFLELTQPEHDGVDFAVRDPREEVGKSVTLMIENYSEKEKEIQILFEAWIDKGREREWVAALEISHLVKDTARREIFFDDVFQKNLPRANKALIIALHKLKYIKNNYPEEQIARWKNVPHVNSWVIETLTKEK